MTRIIIIIFHLALVKGKKTTEMLSVVFSLSPVPDEK